MKLGKLRRLTNPEAGLPQFLLTLLVLGAFLALYRSVLLGLVQQWLDDENYTHGLLVPPIAAFLLYRCLDRLPRVAEPSLRAALPFLLPGLALFVGGTAAAELFTLRLSMLFLFWAIVRGFYGVRSFRGLRFPLFFLVFMIPLPYVFFYRVAFPLQLLSAEASGKVLDFLGVVHVQTGNIIHLRETSLDVVTACSGLRSLLALITFAVLAAGLFPMRRALRALLVVLAVPIAMATNALRIVLTAVLVHTHGRSFLEGALHQGMGLLTFGIGVGLLFLIGGGFRWQRPSV
ncbi:exosortase/archaeosortase family protein [bacterium]|nr:exosortase/archaeosortase family protein [bacterium]